MTATHGAKIPVVKIDYVDFNNLSNFATDITMTKWLLDEGEETFTEFKPSRKPYVIKTRNSELMSTTTFPGLGHATSSRRPRRRSPVSELSFTNEEDDDFVEVDSAACLAFSLKVKQFDIANVKMVTTEDDLRALADVLNQQVEFAVDVEHNHLDSYVGMTCLLQVSTRTDDYVIDTIKLWDRMDLLKTPFANAKILKVYHAAKNDMRWLFRDFGLQVNNLFDTQVAMRHLKFERLGLKRLVKIYCGIDLDKSYQTADWSVRPLPKELIDYAAQDTHHLLYCYDNLVSKLQQRNLLKAVLKDSEAVARSGKIPPSPETAPLFSEDGDLQERYETFWNERKELARRVDQNTQNVLSDTELAAVVCPINPKPLARVHVTAYVVSNQWKKRILAIHEPNLFDENWVPQTHARWEDYDGQSLPEDKCLLRYLVELEKNDEGDDSEDEAY